MSVILPSEHKLDVLRGDVLIAFGALVLQAEIAARFIELGADDHLVTIIDDAAARARALVRLKHALVEAKRDADLTGEVAAEYRAKRKPTSKTAEARS